MTINKIANGWIVSWYPIPGSLAQREFYCSSIEEVKETVGKALQELSEA